MSEFLNKLAKTREYLDYLEQHYENFQKAGALVKEALKDEPLVQYYLTYGNSFQRSCDAHDLSKFSKEEFIPYREYFYPTDAESQDKRALQAQFNSAWEHHWQKNIHHHELWAKHDTVASDFSITACVLMICDWVAMSIAKQERSPREYYESHRNSIDLPDWAERILIQVCDYMEDKPVFRDWNDHG